MPNFTFDDTIPASGNNPSADQPIMLINNASTESILAVNHYTFNDNDGGLHLDVEMPAIIAKPTIYNATSGALYTKTANGHTQLYYNNQNTANEYQLTRANDSDFATFSTDPGWSFLPGGLIIQWGVVNFAGGDDHETGTVTLPFTSQSIGTYSVTATLQVASSSTTTASNTLAIRSVSLTDFKWVYNSSSSSGSTDFPGFYWIAIGS